MLSREINKLIQEGDKGVEKLYTLHIKYFQLIDQWSERLTNGDLLNEYEIAQCMEQMTGCLMKLGSCAGGLEAIMEEMEHNVEVKKYGEIEKIRTQDTAIVKAVARDSVSKIRKWTSDFRNYFNSAQSAVVTAQSRLKRLTVERGAKYVDYTGEIPITEKIPSTGDPLPQQPSTTCESKNEW